MRCKNAAFALAVMLSASGAALAAVQPPHQHQHAGTDPKSLGVVRFDNSCSPAVQERIGRGMALLHSFWYEEVDRHFREVAKEDPTCAMAWWDATASMPARYAVERRQWAEAARLPEPVGFPGGRYAWAEAATYFARALGAARTDDVEQARRDVDRLGALQRTLVEHKEDYWAGQVHVQHRAAGAWLAFAEGRREKALELMREAAALSDRADKYPVTPGQIVPARDLLGQMLLELNRPEDALAEFTRVLAAEPNRFGALAGAARAAELAGRGGRARELYQMLLNVAPNSDRGEVRRAHEVIAGKRTNS